jgi:hypothetical protein
VDCPNNLYSIARIMMYDCVLLRVGKTGTAFGIWIILRYPFFGEPGDSRSGFHLLRRMRCVYHLHPLLARDGSSILILDNFTSYIRYSSTLIDTLLAFKCSILPSLLK